MSAKTILSLGAHGLSQLIKKTMRIHVERDPGFSGQNPYIYGFWHGSQLMTIVNMVALGNQKHAALVSASEDGDLLRPWLERLGYDLIRGSSSRKALSGLRHLIYALKEGYSVGLACDGPRGPYHQAKEGIAYLAIKTGIPIVPIGSAISRKIQFKSWDKYELPLPFSKGAIYLGRPIKLREHDNVQLATKMIEQRLKWAHQNAHLLVAGKPIKSIDDSWMNA